MSNALFNEFPGVSSKEWKQKIQFDLKGADYNNTLIWHSNEGIDVKPFYHPDDFSSLTAQEGSDATQWQICETIYVADVKKSNQHAQALLKQGVDCIKFIIPSADINLKDLLNHIPVATPLYFDFHFLDPRFIETVLKLEHNTIIETDIIGQLARSGNWFNNLKEDFQNFDQILKQTKTLTIDTSLYQNAGANMVQQLAYGLSHANEYLNHINNHFSETEKKDLNITFKVAVGTNYFFEIAKLKALRLLWSTLSKAFEMDGNCQVFAQPTRRNKTLYDYNSNMLRTTTECMSAILGGANIVNNLHYDAIYHKVNDFGERISINQLLVLKHESYLNKVANPTEGTYYIESLTNQLAQKALDLFKDLEAGGGFLTQLKEGTIQKKIKEQAQKEQEQFDKQEIVLTGTNKYTNPQDKMATELELYPFLKITPRKTLLEPIIEKRLSETLEQNRLKTE